MSKDFSPHSRSIKAVSLLEGGEKISFKIGMRTMESGGLILKEHASCISVSGDSSTQDIG